VRAISRRWRAFLPAIAWVLALALPTATSAASAAKPNVVFILIDDLGWADVGCNGSTFYQTPNIDRLARQGMRFTDAYAACPVCSPTRASILTGRYPARLHLTDWLPGRPDRPDQKLLRPPILQYLPLGEVTLAKALKPAGYVSASIGKWHLGGEGFLPTDQGFDVNIAGNASGSPSSYFPPYRKPALADGPPEEYLTDRLTTEAEKFIETNKDRPFFLYLAHYAVHIPLAAKQALIAKYQSRHPGGGSQTNYLYAAMVESVDDSVGRIVRKLDQLKLSERTVIFFTSDNGGLSVKEGPHTPSTSNAPLRAGKGYLYEGGIREPLIVKWPRVVRRGGVCRAPVCSVDFFPTILEMTGVSPASDRVLDGLSLVSLLKQTGVPPPRTLCWHYPHYSNQGGKPGGAIREGDYKLIEFYEDNHLELYNLVNDLGEKNNLAARLPDLAHALQQKLAAWRTTVDAQMPTLNPGYRPAASPSKIVLQSTDGIILLHARDVSVHGSTVRYEPDPHKNTVGFWTRLEDWVSWEFEVTRPGLFSVEILQGCGTGSGGSQVEFQIGAQLLPVTVQDTGGFQNFITRNIGVFTLDRKGRYTLSVKPKTKPGLAVMDLRSVTLRPVVP
jgi:arylsulfatase A-like enzyme